MLTMNPLKEEKSVVPNFDEISFRAFDFSLLNPKLHEIDWRVEGGSFKENFPPYLQKTFRAIRIIKDVRNEDEGVVW